MSATLEDFKKAKKITDEVEDKLYSMVSDFNRFYPHSRSYEDIEFREGQDYAIIHYEEYCMGESDHYDDWIIPTSIIEDYLAGNKEKAIEAMREYRAEEKRKIEEERKRREEEAKKQRERDLALAAERKEKQEYELWKKLNEKYGSNTNA